MDAGCFLSRWPGQGSCVAIARAHLRVSFPANYPTVGHLLTRPPSARKYVPHAEFRIVPFIGRADLAIGFGRSGHRLPAAANQTFALFDVGERVVRPDLSLWQVDLARAF